MIDRAPAVRHRSRRGVLVASALIAATLTLGVFAGTAGAGDVVPVPVGVVDTVCDGGEGFIDIEIIDDSSETYDVFIDGVLVAEAITDTDGVPIRFGPYADGDYAVVVTWLDEGDDIIDDVYQLDCGAPPMTEVEPPATTATSAPPAAAPATAAAASPRFTG